MLEKIGFTELVRYFFSGILVAIGAGFARGTTIDQVHAWADNNKWAAGVSATLAATIALMLLGYASFTLYRTVIFDWGIVSLQGTLGRLFGRRRVGNQLFPLRFFYTCRELLTDAFRKEGISNFSAVEAERVYRTIRQLVVPEFYKRDAPQITAGIHFLYFAVTVLGLSSLVGRKWLVLLSAVLAFVLVLCMDLHYENEEVLRFLAKPDELERELKKLVRRWKPLPIQNPPREPSDP